MWPLVISLKRKSMEKVAQGNAKGMHIALIDDSVMGRTETRKDNEAAMLVSVSLCLSLYSNLGVHVSFLCQPPQRRTGKRRVVSSTKGKSVARQTTRSFSTATTRMETPTTRSA
jgi:hypothetical protein